MHFIVEVHRTIEEVLFVPIEDAQSDVDASVKASRSVRRGDFDVVSKRNEIVRAHAVTPATQETDA